MAFSGTYNFLKRFQSTFPHGERRISFNSSGFSIRSFNPRSRTGNDSIDTNVALLSSSFNPRSRTGNDLILKIDSYIFKVSIHVPARGTTGLGIMIRKLGQVSIHVPARGTTAEDAASGWVLTVSIHVPARGTTHMPENAERDNGFQSTFPHGERLGAEHIERIDAWFQSTFPHGERHIGITAKTLYDWFQSTFPHGERRCSGIL